MGIEVFFNSDGTGVTAAITVIDSNGNHVDPDSWPITNDPAIVLSSHPSAAKTITKVDTGVYTAAWSSLSPALNNGDIVNIAIDGAISGVAWTTWRNFLQVMRLPASQSSVDTVDTVVDAIKVKTDQLTFTVSNQVDANALTGGGGDDAATIYTYFTTGTNEDAFKADVSSLASQTSVDNLTDISAADVYTHFTTGTNEDAFKADVSALASQTSVDNLNDLSSADVTAAVPTVGQVADAVWDEALSGHNLAGSTGKAIRQVKEGTITIEAAIDDTSATTTSFVTNLTESTTSFYSNKIMVFISGSLSGQARIITNYNGTTKAITLEEALTSAPADGDEFLVLATHENSIGEIQAGLATAAALAVVDANVDNIVIDTTEIGTAGAGLTAIPWNASWDAEVQSEVNDALIALHLDHLLAADYDPASKPGVSTALFNELIENDGGLSRFTANALEQAPTGGGGGAGAGAFKITLTTKLGNGSLVSECDCIFTTSDTAPDVDIYANDRSDANANVIFYVDAGTYYLWRQKAGVNFGDNPVTVAVDSSGNVTLP